MAKKGRDVLRPRQMLVLGNLNSGQPVLSTKLTAKVLPVRLNVLLLNATIWALHPHELENAHRLSIPDSQAKDGLQEAGLPLIIPAVE